MSSKDVTFTPSDVLRIFRKHLTKPEKMQVLLFFLIIVPASGIMLSTMEVIVETLFPPGRVLFLILRLMRIFESIVERAVDIETDVLIWLVLDKPMREESKKTIDQIQKDFIIFR